MATKKSEPRIQIIVSESANEKLRVAATRRGFKSRAAYLRSLILQDAPELAEEFEQVQWGGHVPGSRESDPA